MTMDKIREAGKKVLYFFRLTDAQTKVSLTNILMIVMIYKVFTVEATNVGELTALVVASLGYQVKRFKGESS